MVTVTVTLHTGAETKNLTQRNILPSPVPWKIPQTTIILTRDQKPVVWAEEEHSDKKILKGL